LGDWLAEDPEAAALAGLATEQAEGAGANGAAVPTPTAAVTATATATAPPTEGFTKLFVSNIGWTTEPEDIHAHFSSCGEVVDVGLPIMPDGRSKGFAFVEFADPAAAAVAVATLAGIELDGRELVVEAAGAPKTDRRSKAPGGTRVFVQRLSYDTTWETLKDFFKQAGDVTYASVSERPDGSSKGCGIVQFQTAEEAQAAIKQLDGAELDGFQISVREDRQEQRRRDPYQGSDSWNRQQLRGHRSNDRDIRPGDWACPSCNSHVFASKSECFHCGEPRPDRGSEMAPARGYGGGRARGGRGGRGAPETRPGDWTCPECNANVFASKWECYRCGCAKP